jgi:hypothetical protein
MQIKGNTFRKSICSGDVAYIYNIKIIFKAIGVVKMDFIVQEMMIKVYLYNEFNSLKDMN